jgi:DNA-binding NtrC family response regulator
MAERKTRILFVDDDIGSIGKVRPPFSTDPDHYEVTHCETPEEATRLVREKGFDVIVTDIAFSKPNTELVEKFLTECTSKGIPTIVYTNSHFYAAPPKLKGIEIVYKYKERPEKTVERIRQIGEQHSARAAEQKKPAKVLVVHDSGLYGKPLAEFFDTYSGEFQAAYCRNPKEADEIMKTEKFDLLVCDINFSRFSPGQVEEFLHRNLGIGQKLIITSRAKWKIPPKLEGLSFTGPDFDLILREARRVIAENRKVKLDPRELRRLVNL